jgi:cytochrome c peroxidase
MTDRMSAMVIVTALLAAGCGGEKAARPDTPVAITSTQSAVFTAAELANFSPLPAEVATSGQPLTDAKIALGRTLFYENLLSEGHDVSCNSCHALNGWGADGRRVSLGHDGHPGTRNAPTVYNAAGHLAQFWDGRAKDVETQATGPILNPVEMGMPDSAAVLAHLRGSSTYLASFRAAFPDERQPVTYDNVGRAIGAFERRLLTPSRWDRFLSGDTTALTIEERHGLRTFLATGCQQCHRGTYVGGGMYAKAGAVTPWFSRADSGRYQVTRDANDLLVFKVPSLRNVEKTGPYFHDGSVADLNEAVRLMAHHQLGKELAPAQVQAIVTWLRSLTGEIPVRYIALPQQPM